MDKKNEIIMIGYIGLRKCYLNISEDDAIDRYCKSESISIKSFNEDMDVSVFKIKFDDEFGAYDLYE